MWGMEGFFSLLEIAAKVSIVLWPLGLWKLVEIILWLVHHVHFG